MILCHHNYVLMVAIIIAIGKAEDRNMYSACIGKLQTLDRLYKTGSGQYHILSKQDDIVFVLSWFNHVLHTSTKFRRTKVQY